MSSKGNQIECNVTYYRRYLQSNFRYIYTNHSHRKIHCYCISQVYSSLQYVSNFIQNYHNCDTTHYSRGNQGASLGFQSTGSAIVDTAQRCIFTSFCPAIFFRGKISKIEIFERHGLKRHEVGWFIHQNRMF